MDPPPKEPKVWQEVQNMNMQNMLKDRIQRGRKLVTGPNNSGY